MELFKDCLRFVFCAAQFCLFMTLSACGGSTAQSHIPLAQYSREFQKQAADELKCMGPPCPQDSVIPGCSAHRRLDMDYKDLRNKVKVNNDEK